MTAVKPNSPVTQPEDYRAILQRICRMNWVAAALALAIELLIRFSDNYEWPQWGNFSWTYNAVLAEFVAVTTSLTLLLRETRWLDRAPREALGRLRWLLLAVMLLNGLHFLAFFKVTGALQGPLLIFVPVGLLAVYLLLPSRDAHLVNTAFVLALLLLLLAQSADWLTQEGMLSAAFHLDGGISSPFALLIGVALFGAALFGRSASQHLRDSGLGLFGGVSYDPVTRLFSREVLERRVPGELDRIGRVHSSAALLMIEFRNLAELIPKADYSGFSAVLIEFANGLKGATRQADTCSQYERNTFAVLLPTASGDGARQVVERILHATESIHSEQASAVPVQLAVGVATTDEAAATDAEHFMAAAREALVEAQGVEGSGHQVVFRRV